MRPKWIARTEAFVSFIQDHELPQAGTDEWNMLVNKFAESQPYCKRTQMKISGLMKTLHAHASQPLSDTLIKSLIEPLKSENISAVDEATIRSCMEIYRAAMARRSTMK
jgi:hypothetical protein